MNAAVILGTLKPDLKESNTNRLAELLCKRMRGVKCRTLHLAAMNIHAGTEREVEDKEDQMEDVYRAIGDSEVVVFATPIWWNQPSSLIQKVIERLDAVDNEYRRTGRHPYYGKVFGVLVTGTDDGFMSCMARLMCWASQLGFTIPPEAYATWASSLGTTIENDPDTEGMLDTMARNLVRWAETYDSRAGQVGLSEIVLRMTVKGAG